MSNSFDRAQVALIGQRKRATLGKVIAEVLRNDTTKSHQNTQKDSHDQYLTNMLLSKHFHPVGTEDDYASFVENLCLSNRKLAGKSTYFKVNKRAAQFIRNNGRPVLTPINFYSTQNYVYRHGINSYRPPVDIGINSQIEKALTKAAKRDTSPLKLTPMQEAFLLYVHPVRGIEFEEDYIRTVLNTPQYAAFVESLMTNPKFIISTLS